MKSRASNQNRVVPLRPAASAPPRQPSNAVPDQSPAPTRGAKEPLLRHVIGGVLRRHRHLQERTLKEVADAARISMPYLSELERGRKEASSEVLAAVAHALGLDLVDLLGLVRDEMAVGLRERRIRERAARELVGQPVTDGRAVTAVSRLGDGHPRPAGGRATGTALWTGEVRLAA